VSDGAQDAERERRARNHAIDGLRGIAALSVFVFHAWLYTLPVVSAAGAERTPVTDLIRELRLGLVLFFVLSGFLLYRAWASAGLGRRPVPDRATYAVHRIGRIIPAYWLAIVGSIALLYPIAGSPGVRLPPPELLPLFFVFAQNMSPQTLLKLDPPMWTLAVEAVFYVLLPLFGWLALRGRATGRAQLVVPAALLLLGVAFNAGLVAFDPDDLRWSKSLPAMLPYFAVGMGAAVLVTGRRPSAGQARALAAGAFVLVAVNVALQVSAGRGADIIDFLRVIRDLPAALGFAMLICLATTTAPRSLAWKPLAWCGLISYGLYLWHVPVLLVLRAAGLLPLDVLGATLVGLPVSLLAGWLSFRFVEAPAIAWSRRTGLWGANVSGSARGSD
jgi:peptidoglycan/LPS O-acetylase OafA/YrhL